MVIINIIKYIGLNDLDDLEQSTVKSIIEGNYEKIHRLTRNITNLTVHVKIYEKREAAKKYSIHLRAESPTQIFTVNNADWDLARVLHKSIEGMVTEIEHKLKTTPQRDKELELKKIIRKKQ